jgi:hypothetical protein
MHGACQFPIAPTHIDRALTAMNHFETQKPRIPEGRMRKRLKEKDFIACLNLSKRWDYSLFETGFAISTPDTWRWIPRASSAKVDS